MNGIAVASAGSAAGGNILINGGFDFFQRTAPATPTSRADDTYGPDRWVHLNEANPVNVERITGEGPAVSASRTTQANVTAQRFGLAQIVEGIESVARRGTTVRFDFRVRMSTGQALRYAVLEWTGTVDAVTSDVVLNWTSAVYTAGNFFLAANLTVAAVGSISPTSATWTSVALAANISASANNLIVMIWTEGTAAQNIQLDLTRCGLYDGALARAWLPNTPAVQREQCQRFFEKTYALDVAPGTVTTAGIQDFYTRKALAGSTAGGIAQTFPFQAPKRVIPTVLLWNPTTGASGSVRVGANSRTGATGGQVGDKQIGNLQFDATSAQAVALDDEIFFQWTADAEL